MLTFGDAGLPVSSIEKLLDQGVYMPNAVKCGKVGYGIKAVARLLSLRIESGA